jgi:predicted enzyme related to lactoylglutathione lyase
MTTSERPTIATRSTEGRFFWYDVLSQDHHATERFLSQLFGWTATKQHVGQLTCHELAHNGRAFGSVLPTDDKDQPQWLGCIAVADVAAAVKKAEALGAKVVETTTAVEGVGALAVIADPQGALVKLFSYDGGARQEPDMPGGYGQVCWSEMVSDDPAKAKTFYEKWLGWTATEIPMGRMGTYYQMSRDGRDVAGIMKQPPGVPYGSTWLHYVKVGDLGHALHQVNELGGKLLMGPMAIPNVGQFAIISEPGGARFALYTP